MTNRSADRQPAVSESNESRLLSELLRSLDERNRQAQHLQRRGGETPEITVDIAELLYYILSKWYYLLLGALIFALVVGASIYNKPPVYTATSKLYIMGNTGGSIIADLQVGSALTMDYLEVFKTWEVHEMVKEQLDADYSYSQLQSMLTVTNPSDTRLLYITVKCGDPQDASDIANAYAQAAQQFISRMMGTDEPNQFSSALVPSMPSDPGLFSTVVKAILAGTALVALILGLCFVLDNRPKSADDIMRFGGIPMLAVIPTMVKGRGKKNKKRRRGGYYGYGYGYYGGGVSVNDMKNEAAAAKALAETEALAAELAAAQAVADRQHERETVNK